MHRSTLAKRVHFFLLLAFIIFYFYGLGHLPLLGPDEPRYAQVAREMFLRGDYVTPTLGGHTWFEKPALLYWMEIAAFKIFGVSEWSARLGPAICGLLTIAAIWMLARKVELTTTNQDWPGYASWTALIAASCLGLIGFSRGASFDIVITMTTAWALTLFCYAELTEDRREQNWLLFGFYCLVGLSLIAKGLVGIVIPFGVVGLYYLLRREWPKRNVLLSLFWGLPLSILVASIWYGPVIYKHRWLFIDEFFIQHHFARYLSNKYHHPQPFYFYLIGTVDADDSLDTTPYRCTLSNEGLDLAWAGSYEPVDGFFIGVAPFSNHLLLILRFETPGIHPACVASCAHTHWYESYAHTTRWSTGMANQNNGSDLALDWIRWSGICTSYRALANRYLDTCGRRTHCRRLHCYLSESYAVVSAIVRRRFCHDRSSDHFELRGERRREA